MSESLTIDLEIEIRDALIKNYVKENMCAESSEVFYNYLETSDIETALMHSVINMMVISALTDHIARVEFAEALKNNKKEGDNDNTENT